MSGFLHNSTPPLVALAFLMAACSQQEEVPESTAAPTKISVSACIKAANQSSEADIAARYESQFATREAIRNMSDEERERSFIRELTLRDRMHDELFEAQKQNAQACKSGNPALRVTHRAP